MTRKGIILAGGSGTRLRPVTKAVNKQLLPIFDKPMIYYSLSTLMLAGIRDILLISTPEHLPSFQALLGDGSLWGLNLVYRVQDEPNGIAQAFIIGEDFIGDSPSVLILGDNIFHSDGLSALLQGVSAQRDRCCIFGYYTKDPSAFGVVVLDEEKKPVALEEKPAVPRSNWAVPGLYFYPPGVAERARHLKPSPRGELEITDLNATYLAEGALTVELLGRGTAWLDSGTFEAMLSAAEFVHAIETCTGLKIACPEEIAFRMGFIDRPGLKRAVVAAGTNSSYGDYLERLLAIL